MVLVPLGISVGSWSKSIDPKSKSRSANSDIFTDDTGLHTFHKVTNGKNGSKSDKKIVHPKIISPVQQVLQQNKEKEKRADGPDTENITFNMASTSHVKKKKTTTRKKSAPSTSRSNEKTSTTGRTIKRLQRKRNTQSKTKLSGSKKSKKK